MPYSAEHKQKTRANIIESARVLFNRHGFQDVTLEQVMNNAGLTHGGFYNHFKSKEELYGAAVSSFLMGRGAQWRAEAGVDPTVESPEMARQMIQGYLSPEHLGDLDGQCPMIALPSDVARANPEVQASYQELLQAMVSLFGNSLKHHDDARQKSLTLAALCIGGMVVARTLPDSEMAEEVRLAALKTAHRMTH
jgi:AcrR family transcriptional regulator